MPKIEQVILHSGGLRSLISLASAVTQTQPDRIALLHLREGRVGGATIAGYAQKQADHFGVEQCIDLPLLQLQPSGKAESQPQGLLTKPRMLMIAMSHAITLKAKRIVWPMQVNADHARVAKTLEQAMLVEHLSQLDHEKPPTIKTPLVELTDKQLIELGGQLDVPWELAWSCQLFGEKPCGMCDSCTKRHIAFEAAGMIDPAAPAKQSA